MRTLEQQITQYAAYHRDRRNIVTHFIGVPMIVFSVLMALVSFSLAGINVALIVLLAASAYYLILDRPLGFTMAAALFVGYLVAIYIASRPSMGVGANLGLAAALFMIGWIIQFVGHKYEGVKPAFFDDVMGLAIGPLFVMTEAFFHLGLKPELQRYVEARVGPTLAARNGATIGPASS
ncbi:MAG: DUF962 domain-containing protein [Betaproteobacteria bacterium]|nr:DUF962 domain-containing protein [Betaproteobacteria bacterium]